MKEILLPLIEALAHAPGDASGERRARVRSLCRALDAVGPIHHVLIITTAFLMGFGYWAFISNVLLTVANKRGG